MRKDKLKDKLRKQSSYLRWSDSRLSDKFDVSERTVRTIRYELKQDGATGQRKIRVNTLIISDLHFPFEHKEALNFCIRIKEKWDCKRIVFLGDIIDGHFSSFHGISTRAKGADEELELTKEAIKPWYQAFPKAYICTGNHDAIFSRKLEASGVSNSWLRPIPEVLEIPNWKFKDSWEFEDFVCIHGTDGKVIKNKLFKYGGDKSIIQGHFHSDSKIEYYNNNLYGMQLGCLIDKDAYAFEYAKNTSAGIILSIGVIVNGVPIIETLK